MLAELKSWTSTKLLDSSALVLMVVCIKLDREIGRFSAVSERCSNVHDSDLLLVTTCESLR